MSGGIEVLDPGDSQKPTEITGESGVVYKNVKVEDPHLGTADHVVPDLETVTPQGE